MYKSYTYKFTTMFLLKSNQFKFYCGYALLVCTGEYYYSYCGYQQSVSTKCRIGLLNLRFVDKKCA